MFGGGIALVAGKAEMGGVAIHDAAHAVAGDLGNNRSGGNRDAAAVAADQGEALAGQAHRHVAAINQHAVGAERQTRRSL
ncbi:hypothetical protein D9M68_965330 [compost metagenome]